MTLNAVDKYPQYQVPTENNTSLIAPSLEKIQAAIASPITITGIDEPEFCGKPLKTVRQDARQEVVSLALRHTQQYSNVSDLSETEITQTPLVLSGHQPELFHPGVWFKNFLLSRLANKKSAIAINFLVDNDLCRSTAIRVPAFEGKLTNGDANSRNDRFVVAKSVPFDSGRQSIPWELRSICSTDVWQQFPKTVQSTLIKTAGTPLLNQLWPLASEALKRTGNIGLALAEARHRIERDARLETLEVPLSSLTNTRAFARFSIQLLGELPRFQEIYNTQRNHYRQAHGIRNSAHPVPALEQVHGWLEAPWWVYRPEAPDRKQLWVRLLDDQLILSDRAGWQEVIEGRLDCDNASSQWLDLVAEGVCIRPRALLTTMYLRLVVGDLFVHGIGGGKYDQLTNSIMREFFCVEPPPMAVATATMHLSLESHGTESDERAIEAEIRSERQLHWQLQYHADSVLEEPDERVKVLARQKSKLLENVPPRGEKWQWHREITAINQKMRELSSQRIQSTTERIEYLLAQQRQHRILNSREYSFCLHPHEYIISHLSKLTAASNIVE